MKSRVVGFIFARGGSKGVPRKNIRQLAGKPLIAWAIECGLKSRLVDRVVVSTEDPEIAEIAESYGAEVPFMRPAQLAGDRSPEWLAWQHAIETIRQHPDFAPFEIFVSIPTTSPLRQVQDLDQCIETLQSSQADLVITVKEAARNPYFNQVVLDADNRAGLVIPPPEGVHFRQTAPKVYDMTTVAYAARPDYVLGAESIFQGEVRAVTIPEERALDIDSELDFKIAEFLMTSQGNSQ